MWVFAFISQLAGLSFDVAINWAGLEGASVKDAD